MGLILEGGEINITGTQEIYSGETGSFSREGTTNTGSNAIEQSESV